MRRLVSRFFQQTIKRVGACAPTLFLLMTHSAAVNGQATRPLADSLTSLFRQHPQATINLAVQSLTDSTQAYSLRADEPVLSASVIKLPILIEAMERAKAGTLDLGEIHILTDSEKVGGTGVLNTYSHRSRIAYADLLRLMMVYSDNTATNILINELSMAAINGRMHTLCLTGSRLNRLMMDTLAVRKGRENYVTARDMNQLLIRIDRKQLATPELCGQMLGLLRQNEDTLTIPRLLPAGTVVAHKTGILPYVRGDAGLIYAPRPFVLSVFVQGVPTPEAEQLIADVARICYDLLGR